MSCSYLNLQGVGNTYSTCLLSWKRFFKKIWYTAGSLNESRIIEKFEFAKLRVQLTKRWMVLSTRYLERSFLVLYIHYIKNDLSNTSTSWVEYYWLIKHFLVFPHFNRSYCSLPGESLRSSRLVFGGFFCLFVVVFL